MKQENFLTYQKFNDKGAAIALYSLLLDHEIEVEFEDSSSKLDATFANNELNKEFRVKLQKADFEKADAIQVSLSAETVDSVKEDYYLFDFTDQELLEIITQRDEWSSFDYVLAQKILRSRGKEINTELLNTLRKHRIAELAKPADSQKAWIYAGYLFALMGGLLGLFMGWHLKSHKKTLPNGDSVYGYSEEDRMHGNRIFILGIICLLFWLGIQILPFL